MSDIREDLKAYVDGELTPGRRLEIEAALRDDPSLLEEVQWMKAIGQQLRNLRHDPAPTGAEQVLSRMRRRPWWRHPVLATTALTALFVVVFSPIFPQARSKVWKGEAADMAAPSANQAPGMAANKSLGGEMDSGLGGGALSSPMVTESNVRKEKTETYRTSTAAPSPFPQLLIRTADLTLRVASVSDGLKEANRLASANGGFVSSSNASGSEGQLPQGSISMRVPVKTFDRVCEALRGLGEVINDVTNTDDVTAQVADVEARLKVMRAEEESYVTMLRAARRVGELLEIKERLSQVRQEIESLDAQRKALRDQASYSTINVNLTQKSRVGSPEPPKEWSSDAWTSAVNGLQAALRWLGSVAITVFVYAPIWLPLLGIGWWIARRASK